MTERLWANKTEAISDQLRHSGLTVIKKGIQQPPLPICPCCKLPQQPHFDQFGNTSRVCKHCVMHQGDQPAKQLSRAQKHEALLRERLDACRQSEANAQRELAEAKKQTAAALASRGELAVRIMEAARQIDYGHRCALSTIANDQDVIRWAKRSEAIAMRNDW